MAKAFKVRAILTGQDRVKTSMRARTLAGKLFTTLSVGYSASYALYVHENMEAAFRVGGPRFLTRPWRRLRKSMTSLIVRYLRVGKRSLEYAILQTGTWFIRDTRGEVPMDTGHLRSSAYVTSDGGRTVLVGKDDLGWIQPKGVKR